MSDSTTPDGTPVTFNVKSSNDKKYVLTLPRSTTITEVKEKLAGAEYADLPPDRQRLIYSGRVLKDPDTIGQHKIQDGHTVHLVRSAARDQPPPSTSTSSAAGASVAAGVPTNLATGPGTNPLSGLTGARYAGQVQLPGAGLFGPDGGMGAPPDPEQMATMLSNPAFVSTMNEALQNPQVVDMMIQQNPMLREMGPGARQMLQSPEFRRMMTDPEALRNMSRMSRAMGLSPFGQPGQEAGTAFPAPGVVDTTPPSQGGGTNAPSGAPTTDAAGPPGANPFAAMLGNLGAAGGAPANPFAALFANAPANAGGAPGATQAQASDFFATLMNNGGFGGPTPQSQPPSDGTAAPNPSSPQANPFLANNPMLQNPEAMLRMLATLTGGGGGAEGLGAAGAPFGGGSPAPAAPVDTRPPEERYANQLGQLNDMGFYEFERNIEALRRSGGSVQGAVEYLLNH